MGLLSSHPCRSLATLLLLGLSVATSLQSDVLLTSNGERFVGRVLEETSETISFRSDTAGPLSIPRSQVRELQRTDPTSAVLTVPGDALPRAGAEGDRFAWLQLNSLEWLKGELKYIRNRSVAFESEKLEDLSIKLKDVRQIHSGRPMFVKFDHVEPVFGTVVMSNQTVQVLGQNPLTLPLEALTGMTPAGAREADFWSFRAGAGLTLQSGNTRQATLSSSAHVARRSPATQLVVDYLGNYSETDSTQSANNARVSSTYDVRLNRDWFVRPLQFEWYRDQPANLSRRITAGVGAGYSIFDREELEWTVAAGPAYQYTRFQTVEPGERESYSTPAGVLQTSFKADLSQRVTFSQNYTGIFMSEESGLYSHHAIAKVDFEVKRHLDLNVSFTWDYLQKPERSSAGELPLHSDFRLIFGFGVRF